MGSKHWILVGTGAALLTPAFSFASTVAASGFGVLSLAPLSQVQPAFAAGPGLHELELAHAALDSGESIELDSPLPVFVVVTTGSVVDAAGTITDTDGTIALKGSKIVTNNAGTSPTVFSSDADALSDGAEVNEHRTHPNDTDSEGDGFHDANEVSNLTDPNDPTSHP